MEQMSRGTTLRIREVVAYLGVTSEPIRCSTKASFPSPSESTASAAVETGDDRALRGAGCGARGDGGDGDSRHDHVELMLVRSEVGRVASADD
jgi:hypothetical protein